MEQSLSRLQWKSREPVRLGSRYYSMGCARFSTKYGHQPTPGRWLCWGHMPSQPVRVPGTPLCGHLKKPTASLSIYMATSQHQVLRIIEKPVWWPGLDQRQVLVSTKGLYGERACNSHSLCTAMWIQSITKNSGAIFPCKEDAKNPLPASSKSHSKLSNG